MGGLLAGRQRGVAGDRFDQIELQVLTFFNQITDDRDSVVANMAGMFGIPEAEALEIPIAMVGSLEQIIDALQARRERWGFSYVVVHEPEMEAFAPIVERLAGS